MLAATSIEINTTITTTTYYYHYLGLSNWIDSIATRV